MSEEAQAVAAVETAAPHGPEGPSDRVAQQREERAREERAGETSGASATGKAEQTRDYKRAWRERNADHIATYRKAYRAEHLEEIREKGRERERARHDRERVERERRERRRMRARESYAQNSERHLEAQRHYRAAQRAKDPDAYRASKRAREKRWRDRHKDEQNAKLREKHRENPEVKRALGRRYYASNAEKMKAKRRERYAANREMELARQRRWRDREKRRIEAGLPPRRLHAVSAEQRRYNASAADEFFARSYTAEQIATIKKRLGTKAKLIARFNRDSLRARARAHQQGDAGMRDRFQRSENRQNQPEQERARRRAAREAEDARLDAIARQINDQLRIHPRRRRLDEHDPSAPHAGPASSMGGVGL